MARRRKVRGTRTKYLPRIAAIRKAVAMVKMADDAGEHDAHALFGYRCDKCKTDAFFTERNHAPLRGECHRCGHKQRVEKLTFKILVWTDEKEEMYGLVHKARESLQAGDTGRTSGGGTGDPSAVGPGNDSNEHHDPDAGSSGL